VGAEAKTCKVGDIVGVSPVRFSCNECEYCLKGDTNLCDKRIFLYNPYFGGYCSHVQIDQHWIFHIPKGMDIKKMPPLLCAGITTYAPIKRYQKVGGTCAVLGIGGLGHLALQYANKLGK
jgi:alcohol dehydrogenase (NADP+)